MFPEPGRVRFLPMRDAAREARDFVRGRSRAGLDRDSMLLRALVHCFECKKVSGITLGTRGLVSWQVDSTLLQVPFVVV